MSGVGEGGGGGGGGERVPSRDPPSESSSGLVVDKLLLGEGQVVVTFESFGCGVEVEGLGFKGLKVPTRDLPQRKPIWGLELRFEGFG